MLQQDCTMKVLPQKWNNVFSLRCCTTYINNTNTAYTSSAIRTA